MIEFRTLGMAELEENLGSGTRPIAVRAERLALVAYLALAGSGRYRRQESVVALFWPHLDEDQARSALRHALGYLSRTLDASAVVTRGDDEIAIASEVVRCDAVQFDEAIAVEQLEAAMAVYRGDFLEGFLVSDASAGLERWIEAERTRLRQSAAACASALAERSFLRGDGVSAAAWGRRAVALAPNDEDKRQWLNKLLDPVPDRSATAWLPPSPATPGKAATGRNVLLLTAATVLVITLGSVVYRLLQAR
jgi:DNA-binding SARP family transcriptional activator